MWLQVGGAQFLKECGCGHSLCSNMWGHGQCICRRIWVWSLFLQGCWGVVTVSTRTCGCGHCFYRHIWVWSQIEQGHGDLVSVSVSSISSWASSLPGRVGVVIVSTGACGCGHSFFKSMWARSRSFCRDVCLWLMFYRCSRTGSEFLQKRVGVVIISGRRGYHFCSFYGRLRIKTHGPVHISIPWCVTSQT